MPALSGGGEAEAGVIVAFGTMIVDGIDVLGIACVMFGVNRIGGACVKIGGCSAEKVGVADSSGEGSVEMAGSVPRKIYLNGVFVTVTSTTACEVL